jgi:hypothetical protein
MPYPDEATSAFAFETITVATAAIGTTAATRTPTTGGAGAARAVLGPLELGQVRYRYDGTDPSSTVGHLLEIGQTLVLEGAANIAQFKAIRTGGTSGSLPVTYER